MAWHGADLPAQIYRSVQFERYGLLTFDTSWYSGHYFFTYSVVSPALGSVLGWRLLGVVSAAAAAEAFARLVRAEADRARLVGAVVFAVGLAVPLLVGEVTFLAGLAVGLWALVALGRAHQVIGPILALACTLTSPLAGFFLLLALAAWAISGSEGRRRAVVAGAVAALPLAVSTLAFHEVGVYGFPIEQVVAVLACSAAGWIVVPRRMRVLRTGLLLYGAAAVVLFVIANPVGGNLVRLGSYVAPALVVALGWGELRRRDGWLQPRRVVAVLLVPALFWQWSTGIYALADARNDPTRSAAYFQPLVAAAARLPQPARLEIPFTNQHWEAAYVAPHVPLARGWERQIDVAQNPMFYDRSTLTPARYRAWLDEHGVTAVALPDIELDLSGKKEAALIRDGLPYLHLVWRDAHWSLYRVEGSPGLVSGPAHLEVHSPNSFTLTASRPGTVTVRYRYTRTWSVTDGEACIAPTPDGWTQVSVPEPGPVTIVARPFSGSRDCDRTGGS